MLRRAWPIGCLLLVGCQLVGCRALSARRASTGHVVARAEDPPAPVKASSSIPSSIHGSLVLAARLWSEGQRAMSQGEPAKAIELYQQSLAHDQSFTRAHLSLAAAYLQAGNDAKACDHLGRYLAHFPDDCQARSHYAETLWRIGKKAEARPHFERFLADAQEAGAADRKAQIHAHGRLFELAEDRGNAFEAHLHRGMGLFLLARARGALDDPEGELPREGLLVKAAGELTAARELRPHDARATWYLGQVRAQLGQSRAAQRLLSETDAFSPFSSLSPVEQRHLHLRMEPDRPR